MRYDLEFDIRYSKLSLQLPCHGSGSWSQTCYLRRPWFDPRSVHVSFVVDKVTTNSFFLLSAVDLRCLLSFHRCFVLILT